MTTVTSGEGAKVANGDLQRLMDKARQLALAENWGPAAAELNIRILEIDDRVPEAYTRLARCFRTQGRREAACEMYKQVLAFDPHNRIAKNNLAELEKTILPTNMVAAIEALGSYAEAFSIGISASRRGEHGLAEAALSKAVELWPAGVGAWNALGAVYRRTGATERAQKAYHTALRLERNSVSLVGLAAVARDLHDLDTAERLYKQVLLPEPTNGFALKGLGAVYADQGRLDEAEECFTLAARPATS